jgi:membrane-associated protein
MPGVSVDVTPTLPGPATLLRAGDDAREVPMPHVDLPAVGGWVLAAVFTAVVLDALLPFLPGETLVMAAGVAVADHGGAPLVVALLLAATAGVLGGDLLAYAIGFRGGPVVVRRLRRGRRGTVLHDRVVAAMRDHGRLLLVFGRFLPGVRSAAAYTAGALGHPLRTFVTFTLLGGTLWAAQAVALGYLGGVAFDGSPIAGFGAAWLAALLLTGAAMLTRRPAGSGTRRRESAAGATNTEVRESIANRRELRV